MKPNPYEPPRPGNEANVPAPLGGESRLLSGVRLAFGLLSLLEVFLAFSAILPGLLLVAVIHAVLGTAAAFVSLKIGDGNRVAYLLGILLCAVLVCTCAGLSFFALATEFPENGFVLFTTLPVGGLFATVLVYLVSHRVRERLALRRAA